MKRIISVIICLTLLMSITVGVTGFSAEAATVNVAKTSSNQTNIADRADYMYNTTWVCQKTFTAYAYGTYYTFYAGNTYHLPYGQVSSSGAYIGFGVDFNTFLTAAANANSVFYNSRSVAGSYYSSYYIQDCSGLVSWCWGLSSKQSTRSLGNCSTWIGSVTTYNATYSLQLGDAINDYDNHVVLVSGLSYNSSGAITQIEITEQTIPTTKRTYYTPSALASKYGSYDGIYRYYGTVPAAPQVAKDEWVSDSTGWKYKYADGSYASGWAVIDGETYYFGGNNYMYTGWLNDNGKWYYFNPHNGIMQRGWFKVDGKWYFFDNNGAMVIGWVHPTEDGAWYYTKADGSLVTGWYDVDGITYHFDDSSGAMATGWVSVDGEWQLFHEKGGYEYRKAENLGNSFTAVITPNSAPDKALSLDGNNVELRTKDNSDDQIWTFERQSDGSYKVINKSNGWCMDVQDAKTCNGANVQTWEDNGANAQRWVITKDGDKGYTLRPVNAINNDKVMDVINEETADGTNIVLSTAHYGSNQQFTLNIVGSEIIGDADCDTEVSIADVTYIQEFVAGIITEQVNVLADVNGNGKFDIRDATYIQMYLAKIIDKFPCQA